MRKAFFLSLIVLLVAVATFHFAFTGRDSGAIKILFIGNSLTFANDLPAMIADIADSHGHRLIHESHTPGGTRLRHHASSSDVLRKLQKRSWDFVVLQEQSQFPGFSSRQLSTDVFPYAARLVEEAKKANPHTTVVFYMTMAHRNGDPANKRVSPELLTYEGTQKRINNV